MLSEVLLALANGLTSSASLAPLTTATCLATVDSASAKLAFWSELDASSAGFSFASETSLAKALIVAS